jgi:hypothetical protein
MAASGFMNPFGEFILFGFCTTGLLWFFTISGFGLLFCWPMVLFLVATFLGQVAQLPIIFRRSRRIEGVWDALHPQSRDLTPGGIIVLLFYFLMVINLSWLSYVLLPIFWESFIIPPSSLSLKDLDQATGVVAGLCTFANSILHIYKERTTEEPTDEGQQSLLLK